MRSKRNNNLILLTYYILISLVSINVRKPVLAFTPAVYEPNIKEMKNKSKGFGEIAAQLLYFGENKKAIQVANLAVKLNPKEEKLWGILAEAQMRSKDLISARNSLKQAQILNPGEAVYYFKEASIDFEINKINNSIHLIEIGLSIDPKNPNGYFQLGNSRMRLKEYKKALLAFEKANDLKPTFWQSINNQALVLYEINSKEKAIKLWEKVIELNADAEPMLALAAAKYQKDNKDKKSIDFAKKALLKSPIYVHKSHQKDQLWGDELLKAANELFKAPELKKAVSQAIANSRIKD
ncbi:tetratricopeptide repeat protein [Prochlorococcus sp. MIT 1223]|uniref:tetratricopeptide repeat protein n=1 Tax=Prochlorococcus sp. MIT 1223 TaxID=3096217 RepID=UPI002A75B28F|nr:tetratricopeptide repeat protein [Prochlorococcus sp. MIT 1223]